ncbi:hypothetical protein YC2023_099967 [Brassica napus]
MTNLTEEVGGYMEDGYSYIKSMEMVNKGALDLSQNQLSGQIPQKSWQTLFLSILEV